MLRTFAITRNSATGRQVELGRQNRAASRLEPCAPGPKSARLPGAWTTAVLALDCAVGQRANLVVVTAQGVELYYTHWGANVLDRELFWGPVHATAFARAQR